jgi:hypothetical protein
MLMQAVCDCDCGDQPEFFEAKMVKVRKDHKCCECHKTIDKGEECESASGKWDGEVDRFYTCKICSMIRRDFLPCSCFGNLDMDLQDYFEFEQEEIR